LNNLKIIFQLFNKCGFTLKMALHDSLVTRLLLLVT
jgi:hypothetical protein